MEATKSSQESSGSSSKTKVERKGLPNCFWTQNHKGAAIQIVANEIPAGGFISTVYPANYGRSSRGLMKIAQLSPRQFLDRLNEEYQQNLVDWEMLEQRVEFPDGRIGMNAFVHDAGVMSPKHLHVDVDTTALRITHTSASRKRGVLSQQVVLPHKDGWSRVLMVQFGQGAIDAQLLLAIHGGDKHNAQRDEAKGIQVFGGGMGEGSKQISAEIAFRGGGMQYRGTFVHHGIRRVAFLSPFLVDDNMLAYYGGVTPNYVTNSTYEHYRLGELPFTANLTREFDPPIAKEDFKYFTREVQELLQSPNPPHMLVHEYEVPFEPIVVFQSMREAHILTYPMASSTLAESMLFRCKDRDFVKGFKNRDEFAIFGVANPQPGFITYFQNGVRAWTEEFPNDIAYGDIVFERKKMPSCAVHIVTTRIGDYTSHDRTEYRTSVVTHKISACLEHLASSKDGVMKLVQDAFGPHPHTVCSPFGAWIIQKYPIDGDPSEETIDFFPNKIGKYLDINPLRKFDADRVKQKESIFARYNRHVLPPIPEDRQLHIHTTMFLRYMRLNKAVRFPSVDEYIMSSYWASACIIGWSDLFSRPELADRSSPLTVFLHHLRDAETRIIELNEHLVNSNVLFADILRPTHVYFLMERKRVDMLDLEGRLELEDRPLRDQHVFPVMQFVMSKEFGEIIQKQGAALPTKGVVVASDTDEKAPASDKDQKAAASDKDEKTTVTNKRKRKDESELPGAKKQDCVKTPPLIIIYEDLKAKIEKPVDASLYFSWVLELILFDFMEHKKDDKIMQLLLLYLIQQYQAPQPHHLKLDQLEKLINDCSTIPPLKSIV